MLEFAGLKASNFIKKRFRQECFSVNIVKIFKNSFIYRISLVADSELAESPSFKFIQI